MKRQAIFHRLAAMRVCVVLLALALALGVPAIPVTHAATINVACDVDELIGAINTANGNGEADTLELSAGCTYTLVAVNNTGIGENGLPIITSDITIVGNGATLTRDGSAPFFRIFQVDSGGTLTLHNVTISGGLIPGGSGGGIFNDAGTVTVTHSTFSDNTAFEGGGIFNSGGTLTVTDSTFSSNSGDNAGGGILNSSGTLTVTDSTFSGNSGAEHGGGGILNDAGTVTVTNGTFSGNDSIDGNGGGINNVGGGTLTINNSTISGNRANNGGGGITNDAGGTLTVNNSTISGNCANFVVGGIENILGTVDVTNSILTGNFVDLSCTGIPNATDTATVSNNTFSGSGGIFNDAGTVTLRNTIVANNNIPEGGNCFGPITDGGNNLQFPGATCGTGIPTADPLLGPLANNGGPTLTHALLPGSPAIDAANPAFCPATDQRGVPRPQGASCDIGPFELEVVAAIVVPIDIKPGSDPNSINLSNRGVIPVAILTSDAFDATTVDPSTVCFGDAEEPTQRDCTEAHATGHIEDVDGDGDLDLVLHYETGQTGIDPGDTQACLTGETFDGTAIAGCDAVRTFMPPVIKVPVHVGSTIVPGTALPGSNVEIRDADTNALLGSSIADPDGHFAVSLSAPLKLGQRIYPWSDGVAGVPVTAEAYMIYLALVVRNP